MNNWDELEKAAKSALECGPQVGGYDWNPSSWMNRNEFAYAVKAHPKTVLTLIEQNRELRQEIARLKERLEIEPGSPYDGIYCRDATIKALEQRITEMNGALIAEEARMDWLCDNWDGHGNGNGMHIRVFIPGESDDLRDMIDQAIAKEVKA